VWVEPTGSAQVEKDRFFSEIISSAKTITVKSSKWLQSTKNTQKITKNPEKFLQIDYDMNNPNKAFGAHEKDFRAF
jgi:hypothetical protein